jgi:type II secretory ATPase GspE/PulE/Tfp pilus assembly ATPase PilB-like protein
LILALALGLALSWAGAACGATAAVCPSPVLLAQDNSAAVSPPAGAYLAWFKLLLIGVVYLAWVKLTDWSNRVSMKIGADLGMPPQVWNPIMVGSFLVGLLSVLFVPMFAVGFSVFSLAALVPFAIFFFLRRAQLAKRPDLIQLLKKDSDGPPPPPPLPQDEGAAIEFSPAGRDKQEKQANLIRARQNAQFPALKNTLADLLLKRSELALLDYTRQGVAARFQVDGVWHALPPMEREQGDLMLASLKYLAGLKPEDRRNKQLGSFHAKTPDEKLIFELQTQGVPTGERAQLKFIRQRKAPLSLVQQGMFPDMVEQLKKHMLAPGINIISAPKGEGLTAAWQGALMNSERLVRDCVAIEPEGDTECQVENIVLKHYESPAQQMEVTKTALLTQPDFVAVPKVESTEMMELLLMQVRDQQRSLLLRTTANSAAEALIDCYKSALHRETFLHHVRSVTCQKLIRRLCPDCRQETRVAPETIQKLGGNPKQQQTIYQEYRLPPPEQRVDSKGRPIEIPPCHTCGGLSYLGRIAVFELLELDDDLRNFVAKQSDPAAIEAQAQKRGKLSIQRQAHRLVLLGVTTIAEVQRVFKK